MLSLVALLREIKGVRVLRGCWSVATPPHVTVQGDYYIWEGSMDLSPPSCQAGGRSS